MAVDKPRDFGDFVRPSFMRVRREPNWKLLQEFRSQLEQLGKRRNFSCSTWPKAKLWKNHVIEMSGSVGGLLYVHFRSEGRGFWGVRKNRLVELCEEGRTWWLVLLLHSPQSGYLLDRAAVEYHVAEQTWGRRGKPDYRVHKKAEQPRYSKEFATLDRLVDFLQA